MKIDPAEHARHDWIAHDLMSDFEVEDVWRFPAELRPEQSLAQFREHLDRLTEKLSGRGAAGALFRLRLWLGRIFGWDERGPHPALRPGSIRERYARNAGLDANDLPAPGEKDFVPVYFLENESLAEIENATVHAALHLGRVPHGADNFAVQMAVYVKPKGLFGRAYMAAIKPFRLWIVYPAMMRAVRRSWKTG